MRFEDLLALGGLVSLVSSVPLQKRDADYLSVRRKQLKDMSGRGGDPKEKYFHESIFHPHYDGRFTDHVLDYPEQKRVLKNLLQTYLATFNDLGIETWLMHGSLLGWWWNKGILPWDSDIDVQVSETSIFYLAAYYNMSVFHYETPRIPEGRDYMLEVNPSYKNREQTDKMNVIDARWIDTESGLFIDITVARYNLTHPEGAGIMSCKDGHEYRDTYVFPLRETHFEGAPAKIPYRYKELLEAEYGSKSLVNKDFNDHLFDDARMEWIPKVKEVKPDQPKPSPPPSKKAPKESPKEQKKEGEEKKIEPSQNNGKKAQGSRDQAGGQRNAGSEKKQPPKQSAAPVELARENEKTLASSKKTDETQKKQEYSRKAQKNGENRWADGASKEQKD